VASGARSEPSQLEDEAAFFERWVACYYPRVYRTLLRLLDSTEDVEDAAQEVMLAAWRHLSRFRGEAALTTWLHRIAVNRAFSVKRTICRLPVAVPERLDGGWTALEGGTDPLVQLTRSDTASKLREAVSALPEKQRLVTTLHYYGEATSSEIAAALGMTEATVRSNLRHAHRRLRSLLDEEGRG
jgi:RNA polymerase sigma-70 factor (ECF subfamily)